MRVLVCGSRKRSNMPATIRALDKLQDERPISCIIHGDAAGADSEAKAWAISRGIKHLPFKPIWKKDGITLGAAGNARNQDMLTEGKPDLVVAFAGGTGTADMVARAKRAGVEILEVYS